MGKIIRWAILGTGAIATKFAEDLQSLDGATIVAVGSRSRAAAEKFGGRFNIPHRYADYASMAQDAEVDCVYVATPHPFHHENTLLCLNAGKAVLCEKPFSINAREAMEMIGLAQSKKVLLMEAMWTRFFPAMKEFRELLQRNVIGNLQILTADFGFKAEFQPEGRLFNLALGGGALLDVGVYPISLASMIFGAPATVGAIATLGRTGVDEQTAVTLRYETGALAMLNTTIRADTFCEATLVGTRGRIRIHSHFWKPSRLTVTVEGETERTIELPYQGHGYLFEAAEFMNCLRTGKLESPVMSHQETISIMRTLDEVRWQIGVRYPSE